jgi:hypothetical protein
VILESRPPKADLETSPLNFLNLSAIAHHGVDHKKTMCIG